MKIVKIEETSVLFDNGNLIWSEHEPDCCECNYADFSQLEDTGIEQEDFDEDLIFEEVDGDCGFRFGNTGKMYFVPCYSAQNGYYTDEVDIMYRKNKVTTKVLTASGIVIDE